MIKKIIYSQWSKPMIDYTGRNDFGWLSEKHAWMGLALSVSYARKNFSKIEFYTDNYGKYVAELIGIPFDKIFTELEGFDAPVSMWSVGKFIAIEKQSEPFLHLDADVFLRMPLDPKYLTAPVLVQSVELFKDYIHYNKTISNMLRSPNFVKTLDFAWGTKNNIDYAYNTGVIGGTDVTFLRSYAAKALEMVYANMDYWPTAPDIFSCVVVEQWFIAMLVAKYKKNATNLIWNPKPPGSEPEAIGYHHYIASSKRREDVMHRLSQLLALNEPQMFRRITELFRYQNTCEPIGGEVR